MKKKSNQRITKIKIDQVLRLLEKAEDTNVEDATVINPATDQLTTYPDMNNLRIWTRDNLTKGLDKIIFNKFDSDGQTYMTTLVDGLPLYTKMSKTLQGPTVTTTGLNPILKVTGSPDISSEFIYKTTTKTDYIQIPFNYIRVNSVLLLCFTLDSDFTQSTTQYMLSEFQNNPFSLQIKENSNDLCIWGNTDWETIIPSMTPGTTYYLKIIFNSLTNNNNKITTSYSTDGSSYSSATTHTVTTESSPTNQRGYTIGTTPVTTTTQLPFPGTFDLTKSLITSSNVTYNFVTKESKDTLIETSKPGLWLSNLVQPISGSTAGSWLRSNLINSNESSYNLTNSDTIGNYSNTFTQPALIMERYYDFGCDRMQYPSKGYGNEWVYYNQHFSPSSQGSISYVNMPSNRAYAGRELPDNYFEYKYGSYQSIVFPKNPDIQIYTESDDSCLEYNFYNNFSKIDFIMKAPNSKQTPQPPNGVILKPDGTTGGSITGELTSIDDDGHICTQNIDYIFRSVQAIFSPDYTYSSTDNSLNNTNTDVYRARSLLRTCSCVTHQLYRNNTWQNITGSYKFTYTASMNKGYTCSGLSWRDSSGNIQSGFSSGSSYAQYWHQQSATCGTNADQPSVNVTPAGGFCNVSCGTLNGFVIQESADLSGQTGVNIYLHVVDWAENYRAYEVEFKNPDCIDPFSVWVSTKSYPSYEHGEKVYLIAENVSIDALGNIDKIDEKLIDLS